MSNTITFPKEHLQPIGPVQSSLSIYDDYITLMGVCSNKENQQLDIKCFEEIYHPHPTNIFTKDEFITYLMDRMTFVNMSIQEVEGDLVTEEDRQMTYAQSADFFRNYFTNQDMELMVKISKGGMTTESYRNLWNGMVDMKNFSFRKD